MSEKLCLQWYDFKDNVNSAFKKLREDKDFTDVTLACEYGQQMEAHKVILASSSPFFEDILRKNKHPHPLIYLKGFQSQDFVSILDFLYFGEAKVYQEDLDSFLAIAEEIQVKGLPGQVSSEIFGEQEKPKHPEPASVSQESTNQGKDHIPYAKAESTTLSKAFVIQNQSGTNLQALDEKLKSMMERGQKMIPSGKQANGTPRQTISWICKVCGKEGFSNHIRDHIEIKHLEVSFSCDLCDKTLSSRDSIRKHKRVFHK